MGNLRYAKYDKSPTHMGLDDPNKIHGYDNDNPAVVFAGSFGIPGGVGVDVYTNLQKLIDDLALSGGGTIVGLPTVYEVGTQLRLKAGVHLDLMGGTLRRMFNTSALGAGLLNILGVSNVSISNAILDGNGQNFPTSFNICGLVGCSNVTFTNVRFLSVVDFHAIDIADSTDVLVESCKFRGFYNLDGARQFSEAIQLDPDLAGGGNINNNVRVVGCRFDAAEDPTLVNFGPWPCALGNHAAFSGLYHTDIKFIENTVVGAGWAGLNLLNMNQVTIADNSFKDCLHNIRLRLHDSVAPAQACTGVVIQGNRSDGVTGAFVEFAAPTTANIANVGTGRHTSIAITGNVNVNGGTEFVDMAFGSKVTVAGNTSSGDLNSVKIRFSDRVVVGTNEFDTVGETGIYVHEGTETALAGTGLTSRISIKANQLSDLGFRGVHVNCAATRVVISGNDVIDPSTSAATREGIRVDTGATNVKVLGNTVDFISTVNSPYGISVSSGTGNIVKGNTSRGSTNAYQIAAAGTFVEIEGTGTPEGVVSAAVGSIYVRTDGGAGTSRYFKETGTGNTGWVGK